MKKKLKNIRKKINIINNEILNLLEKRFNLTSKVGIIKKKYGLPIYSIKREKKIIKKLKKKCIQKNISIKFIKDIYYKIISESYNKENKQGFKKIFPNLKKIYIIGSKNLTIKMFQKMFKLSGYNIKNISTKNIKIEKKKITNSDMILFQINSKKIKKITYILKKIQKKCIVVILNIFNKKLFSILLKIYKGPILGLNLLFVQKKNINFAKKNIIHIPGRYCEKYKLLLKQIKIWGSIIYNLNIKQCETQKKIINNIKKKIILIYKKIFFLKKINLNLSLLFSTLLPIEKCLIIILNNILLSMIPKKNQKLYQINKKIKYNINFLLEEAKEFLQENKFK